MIRFVILFGLLVPALAASEAQAADVQFEGAYRARARLLSNLALDTELQDQTTFNYVQHRLWLRPKVLVSDAVTMNVELKALDGVVWGNQPRTWTPFYDGPAPAVFDYDVTSPTSATDETQALLDITLWRAWADVQTDIGRFQFGRMPLHWGTGIWLNDGQSVAPDYADHGDTTDRFMWEYLVRDEFFLRAAIDIPTEGFINGADDSTSFHLATAYRNEDVSAGIMVQVDRNPSREFNLVTIDGTASAELGPIYVASELLGQFGGGDLDSGVNDASISAFGGVLEAKLDAEPWFAGLTTGFASGDKVDSDSRYRTFTFDRDYSLGMFLFEIPMPTLAAAAANEVNGGIDESTAFSGNGISNAIFVRAAFGRELPIEGLNVEGAWFAARTASLPDRFLTRRTYGMEFDASVNYTGVEHAYFGLTFAGFLPGTLYRDFEDETYDNFNDPAFGVQFTSRIEF